MEACVLTGVEVEDEENPVNGVEEDPTVDRALGVGETKGTPLPSGDPDLILLLQSLDMIRARKLHIFSGYAAVGAVWKPTSAFLPVMRCLCLCPQS